MDMLCYMWESVERGVMVKPNGDIYTQDEIVRMIGKDASGSDTWLDRLIFGGVCAVREDGAIYSRRMVRDTEISQKRREAGLKGGSSTKTKVFDRKPVERKEKPSEPTLPMDIPDTPPPLTQEQAEKAAKAKKYKYAEFVTLTRDEYAKLCESFGEDAAKRMIEILDNYKGSKGKKYKSDYKAILNWVVDRYNEEVMKYGDQRQTSFSNDNQGGSGDHQGSSAKAVQAEPGKGTAGKAKAQKDYSERF